MENYENENVVIPIENNVQPGDVKRYTGQIKWFDRSKGYGFITELDEKYDIFVHFSQITGKQDDFRYLVAGEYVEFGISELKTNNGSTEQSKNVATEITGIKSGKLMYEIILEQQASSSELRSSIPSDSDEQQSPVKKFGFSKYKGKKPKH